MGIQIHVYKLLYNLMVYGSNPSTKKIETQGSQTLCLSEPQSETLFQQAKIVYDFTAVIYLLL